VAFYSLFQEHLLNVQIVKTDKAGFAVN